MLMFDQVLMDTQAINSIKIMFVLTDVKWILVLCHSLPWAGSQENAITNYNSQKEPVSFGRHIQDRIEGFIAAMAFASEKNLETFPDGVAKQEEKNGFRLVKPTINVPKNKHHQYSFSRFVPSLVPHEYLTHHATVDQKKLVALLSDGNTVHKNVKARQQKGVLHKVLKEQIANWRLINPR